MENFLSFLDAFYSKFFPSILMESFELDESDVKTTFRALNFLKMLNYSLAVVRKQDSLKSLTLIIRITHIFCMSPL